MNNDSKYEYFQHAGVMGMKWGVRKRTKQVSTSSSNKTTNRRMTNKELTSKVKRLKLEEEYKKLTAPPKTASKVEKLVKGAGTVANLSGSALTLYKNMNELNKIISSKGA